MKRRNVLIVLMLISVIIAQKPANQIVRLEQKVEQNPNNFELMLNLGKLEYQQVINGDKSFLKSAEKHLNSATKLNPENSVAYCWYGSAIVMKAKYSFFPPIKGYYVIAGLKEMDKAIELDPNNIENRFIRGNTCLGIPTFFSKIETAIEDFQKLKSISDQNPNIFDESTKAKIIYKLITAYQIAGMEEDENHYQEMLLNNYPESEFAIKLR